MRDANYAIAAVMVGAVVVTWTLGRIFGGLHHQLAVVRLIVVRICFGLVLAIVTVQAALAGGFWLLLAFVCGLLALFSFAMAAVIVRGWTRGELLDDA